MSVGIALMKWGLLSVYLEQPELGEMQEFVPVNLTKAQRWFLLGSLLFSLLTEGGLLLYRQPLSLSDVL